MTRNGWMLLAGLLLATTGRAEVGGRPINGWHLVEAELPGRLVAQAALPGPGGRLLLLVAPGPAKAPRQLLAFDPAAGALDLLLGDLPAKADALSVLDLDGDGQGEILVGEPGVVHRLVPDGASWRLEPLLTVPHLNLAALVRAGLVDAEEGHIAHAGVGMLDLYAGGADGTLARTGHHRLPTAARRVETGLELTSPPVARLALGDGTRYAVGPVAHGDRRLRTLLLDPSAAAPSEVESEVWAQLPSPETVVGSEYVVLDGRPFLLVFTRQADKLGIFAHARLRLFPLRADRTRAGASPVLAVEIASRHWQQSPAVRVQDVDGDGHHDLVVVQPAGLGENKLVVEAFLGSGDGRFAPKSRQTELEDVGSAWHFGEDLTGDASPDLVATTRKSLRIYPGTARTPGKQMVEKSPQSVAIVGDAPEQERQLVRLSVSNEGKEVAVEPEPEPEEKRVLGRPRLVDLDGNGRMEIFLAGGREETRPVVRWLRPGG